MSESLLNGKINEALIAAGNNRHDATKLLITWAVRDPALLLALTKPHLKAIAAGSVDHYIRTRRENGAGDDDADHLSRSAIDDIVAHTPPRLATDKRKTPVPPPKSTERQASTMRKLAAAFTKKKKE